MYPSLKDYLIPPVCVSMDEVCFFLFLGLDLLVLLVATPQVLFSRNKTFYALQRQEQTFYSQSILLNLFHMNTIIVPSSKKYSVNLLGY